MSVADLATSAAVTRGPSLRFLLSELRLIFRRRRNIAGLGVLAAVPIIIGLSVKYSGGGGGGGEGGFIGQATNNGLFIGLAALTVELPLFLPMAVAIISGDSVAGEATAELGNAAQTAIIETLIGDGVPVRAFGPVPVNLEDVFVTLTGEGFGVSG